MRTKHVLSLTDNTFLGLNVLGILGQRCESCVPVEEQAFKRCQDVARYADAQKQDDHARRQRLG